MADATSPPLPPSLPPLAVAYASHTTSPIRRRRPGGLTAVGLLSIIFGLIGALSNTSTLPMTIRWLQNSRIAAAAAAATPPAAAATPAPAPAGPAIPVIEPLNGEVVGPDGLPYLQRQAVVMQLQHSWVGPMDQQHEEAIDALLAEFGKRLFKFDADQRKTPDPEEVERQIENVDPRYLPGWTRLTIKTVHGKGEVRATYSGADTGPSDPDVAGLALEYGHEYLVRDGNKPFQYSSATIQKEFAKAQLRRHATPLQTAVLAREARAWDPLDSRFAGHNILISLQPSQGDGVLRAYVPGGMLWILPRGQIVYNPAPGTSPLTGIAPPPSIPTLASSSPSGPGAIYRAKFDPAAISLGLIETLLSALMGASLAVLGFMLLSSKPRNGRRWLLVWAVAEVGIVVFGALTGLWMMQTMDGVTQDATLMGTMSFSELTLWSWLLELPFVLAYPIIVLAVLERADVRDFCGVSVPSVRTGAVAAEGQPSPAAPRPRSRRELWALIVLATGLTAAHLVFAAAARSWLMTSAHLIGATVATALVVLAVRRVHPGRLLKAPLAAVTAMTLIALIWAGAQPAQTYAVTETSSPSGAPPARQESPRAAEAEALRRAFHHDTSAAAMKLGKDLSELLPESLSSFFGAIADAGAKGNLDDPHNIILGGINDQWGNFRTLRPLSQDSRRAAESAAPYILPVILRTDGFKLPPPRLGYLVKLVGPEIAPEFLKGVRRPPPEAPAIDPYRRFRPLLEAADENRDLAGELRKAGLHYAVEEDNLFLLALLQHKNPEARIAAIQAMPIGAFDDELLKLAADENIGVSRAASEKLARLPKFRRPEKRSDLYFTLREIERTPGLDPVRIARARAIYEKLVGDAGDSSNLPPRIDSASPLIPAEQPLESAPPAPPAPSLPMVPIVSAPPSAGSPTVDFGNALSGAAMLWLLTALAAAMGLMMLKKGR